jgi:hypothetical protein
MIKNTQFKNIQPWLKSVRVRPVSGWFVMNPDDISTDHAKLRKLRGKWFKISTDKGVAYRILRFSRKLGPQEIVLDWDAIISLDDFEATESNSLILDIQKVSIWKYPHVGMQHPDPTIRNASFLGYVGFVTGLIGLLSSIFTMFI